MIVPLFVGKELDGTERLISVNSYELIKMNRKECFLAYCSKLDRDALQTSNIYKLML